MSIIVPERVRSRVSRHIDKTAGADACWPWQLSVGSHGYPQIGWWADGHSHMVLVHRVVFEIEHGPIPDGLTVDHRCYYRLCCNGSHLQLRTNADNAADNAQHRQTACRHGHAFTPENTYVRPSSGHRSCRECARQRRGQV